MTLHEDQIRERAHLIWERHGRPEEQQDAHWQLARFEVETALGLSRGGSAQKASRPRRAVASIEAGPAGGRTRKSNAPGAGSASGTAAAQRTSAQPKYRHAENPDLTWSGRGRRPLWLRDALEAGRPLADFEVPS